MSVSHSAHGHPMARRGLLVGTAATALTLGTVSFADAAPPNGGTDADGGPDRTRTVRGTLPTGSPDFVYLPVEVPRGVREIAVSYAYERTPV